jgi:hypothetical protein
MIINSEMSLGTGPISPLGEHRIPGSAFGGSGSRHRLTEWLDMLVLSPIELRNES